METCNYEQNILFRFQFSRFTFAFYSEAPVCMFTQARIKCRGACERIYKCITPLRTDFNIAFAIVVVGFFFFIFLLKI